MAKMKVLGQAAVITSSITGEVFDKVCKYAPQALTIQEKIDDFMTTVFAVGFGKTVVNQNKICFNTVDESDCLEVTIMLPEGKTGDDMKTYVYDTYGKALNNLIKVEAQIPGALEQIDADIREIQSHIEF